MQIQSKLEIFPDYLSVTYGPDRCPDALIRSLLLDLEFRCHGTIEDGFTLPDGTGLARLSSKARFTLVSFSGSTLAHIIRRGAIGHLLQILTSEHHKVTRLDLAKDYDFDRPEDVMLRLRTLFNLGTREKVRLGRKVVPAQKVSRIQSIRRDDVRTGTVYFGSRKDRYFARVYDKRAEVWAKQDRDIARELLRVEVVAMRGTATLRDLLEPDSLFFYLAAPHLVPYERGIKHWRKTPMDPLNLPPLQKLSDYEKAVRLIDSSPDLDTLAMLIGSTPTQLPLVMRKLEAKLREQLRTAA